MGKQFTNVATYIGLIFLFVLLVAGLIYLGDELVVNENADLDNDSISYIAEMQGINLSEYEATQEQLEASTLINANYSQGNPKDESIEFLFAKEKGSSIELIVKGIFSVPRVIMFDLLRMNRNTWGWIVNLLNWLWRILIIIATVYFARGLIDK